MDTGICLLCSQKVGTRVFDEMHDPIMKNDNVFETYASKKLFSHRVADVWVKAFQEIVFDNNDICLKDVAVLDYGCGDGKCYHYFIGEGIPAANIFGVEVSRIRIERCMAMGWNNVHFVEVGERLPFDDDFFSVVNVMEVIEHIPKSHVERCLDEICRVTKKDGAVIIATPNYPVKRFYDIVDAFVWRKWSRLRDDPTHFCHYNHSRLHAVLRNRFGCIIMKPYKSGYIYKRIAHKVFMHKILAVCSAKK